MSRNNLTDSKRLILTAIYKAGAQTKRELAKRCNLGWATVSNAVAELNTEGIIKPVGIDQNSISKQGQNALKYDLAGGKPLAIGIDIEYQTTRIIVMDLTGAVFARARHDTPSPVTEEIVLTFLIKIINQLINGNDIKLADLDGIGIGMPLISFPSKTHVENIKKAREIGDKLHEHFAIPVHTETNNKAYTIYQKWSNDSFDYRDFLFVSIRSGLGTGIMYQGKMFNGSDGLSGELGHIKVMADGLACRCGGSGCLETVVNQNYFIEQYRTNVLKEQGLSVFSDISESKIEMLEALFKKAKDGDSAAIAIIKTAAQYLGHCIANVVTILNINNIIVSGYFGPDGDIFATYLKKVIAKETLPDTKLNLLYSPIDPDGHPRGAALLVLSNYFLDIPVVGT